MIYLIIYAMNIMNLSALNVNLSALMITMEMIPMITMEMIPMITTTTERTTKRK